MGFSGYSGRIFFSLGSNVGDRQAYLMQAVQMLDEHFVRLDISGIYQTSPQDYTDQDDFYNIIAVYRHDIQNVTDILNVCHKIEDSLGRAEYRRIDKGPRPIDIDIIAADGVTVDEPHLHIPHAAYQVRNFVLIPLAEVLSSEHYETDKSWLDFIYRCIESNGEQNVVKIGGFPIL